MALSVTADVVTRPPITAEQARLRGEEFALKNLGDQVGADSPWPINTLLGSAWVVPLVLAYGSTGAIGVVGVIIVDAALGHTIGWTPVDQMKANGRRLVGVHQDEIRAARQAYKTAHAPTR